MILKDDGTCLFHGHFHDSGLVSYGVSFAMVVRADSGRAFAFTKTGNVDGTVAILATPTKTRNFDWDDTTQNDAIKAAWADIAQGFDFHWKADVNVDALALLKDVVSIVQVAAPIVGDVVKVI